MKRVILAVILTIVMLTGCTTVIVEPAIVESEPEPEPVVTQPEPKSEPEPEPNGITETELIPEPEPTGNVEFLPTYKPTNPGTKIEFEHLDAMKFPIEVGFGISEHCDLVGVYPGYSERVPILIRNGKDMERLFVIYVVASTKPKEGFEALPEKYLCWLTVEEPRVELGKNEYCWTYILLEVPKDVDYAGKHAEVRIRIDDITQSGFVQIALESEWYITTAE